MTGSTGKETQAKGNPGEKGKGKRPKEGREAMERGGEEAVRGMEAGGRKEDAEGKE